MDKLMTEHRNAQGARSSLRHHHFSPLTLGSPSSQPGCGRAQVVFITGFIADSQAPAEEGCRGDLILHPAPRLGQRSGPPTAGPVLSHSQPFSRARGSPKTQLQAPSLFRPTPRPHCSSPSALLTDKANCSMPSFKIKQRLPCMIFVLFCFALFKQLVPTCRACQFPWCKYSRHGQFHTTSRSSQHAGRLRLPQPGERLPLTSAYSLHP